MKQALDARLKHKTSPAATYYYLLHRHGWRKLTPDKRHPGADALAQDEWKKTARYSHRNRSGVACRRDTSSDVSG
ncbi:helix-turn-helix domain-containing protein [Nitrosomonas communis]|uniref:helix-turn-helix domain-containing protein n=1 Tax=Nitrosomonas communis TaxID=44574 RepID=UPI0037096D9A